MRSGRPTRRGPRGARIPYPYHGDPDWAYDWEWAKRDEPPGDLTVYPDEEERDVILGPDGFPYREPMGFGFRRSGD